ncbi:MAG: metalloregulator ArsR/SmtB family transcription factor [Rhodobacteraceae bacterium]|nr:metalloregulator ArsR/SmtB family transcription factor [Paracoccaceae bacterium]
MDNLASVLRTAGETNRLRLLALCAQGDLSVSELTRILGMSQPGVSRHLRMLCDVGLLERHQEGSWAFFHVPVAGHHAEMARFLIHCLDEHDPLISRDRQRLDEIRHERATRAEMYFRKNAPRWDEIRALHVEEDQVEAAIRECANRLTIRDLLDVGTGTGRMLQLLADRSHHAIGIDRSQDMLAAARVNLAKPGFSHCSVRRGDMYTLPFASPGFDLATLNMVLHFADRPQDVLGEVARVLHPGGHLLIVDFAPHAMTELIEDHAHLRPGFRTSDIEGWGQRHNLVMIAVRRLPGTPLTVMLWMLQKDPAGADERMPAQKRDLP